MKYRKLKTTEILQKGDEYFFKRVWRPTLYRIGAIAGRGYRRPIVQTTEEAIAEVKRKLTSLFKCGRQWGARLVIDHQSFTIVEQTTRRSAEWTRRQLAIAIVRLISNKP